MGGLPVGGSPHTGPGGESRVWRMDELATHQSDEPEKEMTMSSTEEAVRREIEKLEEKVDRLTGGRAENRAEDRYYDWSHSYATNEGDETAHNADESETSDSPYYEWSHSYAN